MNNAKLIGASAIALALSLAPGMVTPQAWATDSVQIERVNITTVAAGFRSTKLVGSNVTNDAGDTIGKVEDVIVSPDGKTPFVIVSVGGFLGVGSRLVAVPFGGLRISESGVLLPGATKDELKTLPEFKYASN